MKFSISTIPVLAIIAAIYACAADPLSIKDSILLDIRGRIDHMAIDIQGKRLFIAAFGNHSIEIIDLDSRKISKRITGVPEPQGIVYLKKSDAIVVSCGGDGSVRRYDAMNYKLQKEIFLGQDADNLFYDTSIGVLYAGFSSGSIAVIDSSFQIKASIGLPGHPEAIRMDRLSGLLYVNVPSAKRITVIDPVQMKVISEWKIDKASENFPMDIDPGHHRLFIACRQPPSVLVYDIQKGILISTLNCVGDADDMFYDHSFMKLYVSGGKGSVDIIQQSDADHYMLLSEIRTGPGARTSLLVPESGLLFVAVPENKSRKARILVYETMH